MRVSVLLAVVALAACSSQSAALHPSPSVAGGGGEALLVTDGVTVGTDLQIRDALRARNLAVTEMAEADVTPAAAMGKRLVVLSYSMLSTKFKADLADVPVPVIVMEHKVLPALGMTATDGHGFQEKVTDITLTSTDPALTAGLPAGDLTVYGKVQEVFWGVPGPGAIKVATVKGNPQRVTYFAYPAGATMVGRTAPAKRMQFFFAAHSPPPVPAVFLNDSGLKLLGAAIDWCLR
jgi:hypothetical protein